MSKFLDGYVVIEDTEHFRLMYNPHSNPLDESLSNYIIVHKKYGKIDVSSPSIGMARRLLGMAEELYNEAEESKEEIKQKEKLHLN